MKLKTTAIILTTLLLATTATAEIDAESDIPDLNVIFQAEEHIYNIQIQNNEEEPRQVDIWTEGEGIDQVIDVTGQTTIEPGEQISIPVEVEAPETGTEEFYTGSISLSTDQTIENIPIAIRATERDQAGISADISPTSEEIRPDDLIGIILMLSGSQEEQHVYVDYELRRASDGQLIENETHERIFQDVETFRRNILPVGDLDLGDHYVQATIYNNDTQVTSTTTFEVTDPFWTPTRSRIAILLIVGGIIIGGGFYAQQWYRQKKEEDSRYVFPVDYSKLPNGEDLFEMGKVAETEKTAHIDPDDLTTHAIVSGSTGSGKSVTANVVAEEALEKDIPVVVFDPTAQWTGFVKELKDDNLLEHYDRFGMDKEEDPHPYRGVIKEISDGDPEIDFKELKNEGEITVFTLNQLTTEQFDDAVRQIIDQIFEIEWEESPDLEMLIVFDEVHRLLEEYGGKGGYHALEKGAREFRKWGIGLMMCSQVTADFKQAISGNIMTEIQMQTKSMEDIKRVEKKYGEQFSKRISSEDVGVGMIQNSNYNDGDPWFVDFRPTYHNPHKIPDKELDKYHELSEQIDRIKDKLSEMEDSKDKELELQLAENKLKEGRFKMARMYISSLEDEMGIS